MFEAIGYVAIGFVTTLTAMEVAWRISRRELPVPEVRTR